MLRLLPLLAVGACGGFNTPPQEVTGGLSLTSSSLPPRVNAGGHALALTRLKLHLSATAKSDTEGEVALATAREVEVDLAAQWTELFRGPLARANYQQVRIELRRVVLEGSWDGAPFALESRKVDARDFALGDEWRVELGKPSVISLSSDPITWLAKVDGQQIEPIDPGSEQATSQLVDRFLKSLTAVRDDDP